jgi:hypothetical protein
MNRSVGNYQRIIRRMAELAPLAILVVAVILAFAARADAYPQANDTQYKSWALGWHKQAVKERKQLVRHTDAIGLKRPRRVPTIREWTFYICETDKPNLRVDFTAEGMDLATAESRCDTVTALMSWRHYGADSKRVAKAFRARRIALHQKMTHPGGSGGARWKPLALYVGWTRAEWPTVLYIMAQRGGTGESGGSPRAANPKPPYCRGLMQLARGWYTGVWAIHGQHRAFDPFDPEANLRAAEGIHDTEGWGPWAL